MPANRYEDIAIHGLDELERRLQSLPEKLRRQRVRKILTAAAQKIQEEAIRRAPTQGPLTGWMAAAFGGHEGAHLRDNIVHRVKVGARESLATVGIDYKKVHHGHLVEFGTRPHVIGRWQHPGSRKQPFMRPAYDATKGMLLDDIVTSLRRAVEDLA